MHDESRTVCTKQSFANAHARSLPACLLPCLRGLTGRRPLVLHSFHCCFPTQHQRQKVAAISVFPMSESRRARARLRRTFRYPADDDESGDDVSAMQAMDEQGMCHTFLCVLGSCTNRCCLFHFSAAMFSSNMTRHEGTFSPFFPPSFLAVAYKFGHTHQKWGVESNGRKERRERNSKRREEKRQRLLKMERRKKKSHETIAKANIFPFAPAAPSVTQSKKPSSPTSAPPTPFKTHSSLAPCFCFPS